MILRGRLADHIRSAPDALYIKKLKFLVLDEADRLLEDTFVDDLDLILSRLPSKRQTLLFTATMTESLKQLQNDSTFIYQSCNTSYFLYSY